MKSTITIDVELDENKIPKEISWNATASTAEQKKIAKALMLSLWDGPEKAAMRIDLWTKDMMVDEMADFIFQSMMTMADTYGRATQYHDQVKDIKEFAQAFYKRFQEKQLEQQKAT